MGEAGKFSSFAFGCVLQIAFNAYCDINDVDRHSIDYYSFCKSLACQLYIYANTLNDTPVAQPKKHVDSYIALKIINYFVWLKCMVALYVCMYQ